MNPVNRILGKKEVQCKICGLYVDKGNIYGKKGCSECAYLNEEN